MTLHSSYSGSTFGGLIAIFCGSSLTSLLSFFSGLSCMLFLACYAPPELFFSYFLSFLLGDGGLLSSFLVGDGGLLSSFLGEDDLLSFFFFFFFFSRLSSSLLEWFLCFFFLLCLSLLSSSLLEPDLPEGISSSSISSSYFSRAGRKEWSDWKSVQMGSLMPFHLTRYSTVLRTARLSLMVSIYIKTLSPPSSQMFKSRQPIARINGESVDG
jgi:hypothetical protein